MEADPAAPAHLQMTATWQIFWLYGKRPWARRAQLSLSWIPDPQKLRIKKYCFGVVCMQQRITKEHAT